MTPLKHGMRPSAPSLVLLLLLLSTLASCSTARGLLSPTGRRTLAIDATGTLILSNADLDALPTPFGITFDGPLVALRRDATSQFFWHSGHFADCAYTKWIGTPLNPFLTLVYAKGDVGSACADTSFWINGGAFPGTSGTAWLYNIYTVDSTHFLGFVHIERDSSYPNTQGMGLAYSTNAGDSWRFLGVIARAPGLSERPRGSWSPMGGMPYVVVHVSGIPYFYVYTNEDRASAHHVGVIRARVADVLAAAASGTVTPWAKFVNGTWGADGSAITAVGDAILPVTSWGSDQVTETDAAYHATLNKYLLLVVDQYVSHYVVLYQSDDGVTWPLSDAIRVDQTTRTGPSGQTLSGFYAWFASTDASTSDDGHILGDDFYIQYSYKDRGEILYDELWRRHVTISGSASPPKLLSREHPPF
jgi:hypothetical protein